MRPNAEVECRAAGTCHRSSCTKHRRLTGGPHVCRRFYRLRKNHRLHQRSLEVCRDPFLRRLRPTKASSHRLQIQALPTVQCRQGRQDTQGQAREDPAVPELRKGVLRAAVSPAPVVLLHEMRRGRAKGRGQAGQGPSQNDGQQRSARRNACTPAVRALRQPEGGKTPQGLHQAARCAVAVSQVSR